MVAISVQDLNFCVFENRAPLGLTQRHLEFCVRPGASFMVLWQRVRLQGLVRDLHLGGQLGAVEEVGVERVAVRLLSRLFIKKQAWGYHFARFGKYVFGFVLQYCCAACRRGCQLC